MGTIKSMNLRCSGEISSVSPQSSSNFEWLWV